MDTNYKIKFNSLTLISKLVLVVYIIYILFRFKNTNIKTHILLLIALYIMLYIDSHNDYYDKENYNNTYPDIRTKNINITNSDNYVVDHDYIDPNYQSYIVDKFICNKYNCYNTLPDKNRINNGTHIQRVNDRLIKNRNTEGRFYVDCPNCDNTNIFTNTIVDTNVNTKIDTDIIIDKKRKTMSFFNDNYVDDSKIFCYNCLIDSKDKNLAYEQDYGGTYIYWPDFENPVNGPPYI